MDLHLLSDTQLIKALSDRGYVIRHKSEARRPISWNRTLPFPDGVDFRTEAIEKIREQIDHSLIEFREEPADGLRPALHRAVLRVL